MKKLISLLFSSLAIFVVSACSSDPSTSENGNEKSSAAAALQAEPPAEGLTIGAFLRGAAPDEPAAKAFERGMELAADSYSKGKLNRTILDRAQGAPDNPAFQPLLAKVPLAVYWQTEDLTPAASALKDSKVIAVPVWNVTEKVAALSRNVFGFGYSTERSFAEFAKFAGAKLKSYRFAVLSSNVEPFSTQSKAFIEESKSLGNTIVFEENVESAAVDFKALVSRAAKENCDTLFAALPGESLIAFIKAARAASFKGKILIGDSLYSTELQALGSDAEGIYVLQSWSDDAALKAQYTGKYGVEPDGVTLGAAALGYDLIKCIEAVGANPDPDAIAYSWLSSPCEGLTGKTQFSGERIAQRVKKILTVKGGKFEIAGA